MNFSDTNSLVASFAIGLVGFAIFVYGKKQRRPAQLLVGVTMMIYPYFVPGALPMLLVAAALVAALIAAVKLGF